MRIICLVALLLGIVPFCGNASQEKGRLIKKPFTQALFSQSYTNKPGHIIAVVQSNTINSRVAESLLISLDDFPGYINRKTSRSSNCRVWFADQQKNALTIPDSSASVTLAYRFFAGLHNLKNQYKCMLAWMGDSRCLIVGTGCFVTFMRKQDHSRMIGNSGLQMQMKKKKASVLPHYETVSLNDDDIFIIIAARGLWEKLNNKKIISTIKNHLIWLQEQGFVTVQETGVMKSLYEQLYSVAKIFGDNRPAIAIMFLDINDIKGILEKLKVKHRPLFKKKISKTLPHKNIKKQKTEQDKKQTSSAVVIKKKQLPHIIF